MDYPATQMFVSDDDADDDDEENRASLPLEAEKDVRVGVLLVDSTTYPIWKGVNKVGRIESCGIVIDHNTISKEHAEIEAGIGSKSIFISDLGSLNKTKLNDAILRPGRMYQLQDGDMLRFGSVQAIFKHDENKEEKTPKAELPPGRFIIPETPVSTVKKDHVIIPGTPNVSFEDSTASRSSIEGNYSGDISLIAGTQQGMRLSDMSRPTVCDRELDKGEISIGSESTPKIDRKHPAKGVSIEDISELETQTDSFVDDSDDENIFEMMTQKTNVPQEETQKESAADATSESPFPSISDLETQKFGAEVTPNARSRSINDLETQKFCVDVTPGSHLESISDLETQKLDTEGTPDSRLRSINDLETQKFDVDVTPGSHVESISDLETQKFCTDVEIGSNSRFINELSTQKLSVAATARSTIGKATEHPMSDAETQKFPTGTMIAESDDEGSETDEEGLFADSGDGTNIFDAPTQLIKFPDKESALKISSDSRAREVTSAARRPDPAKEETPPLEEKEARVNDEKEGPVEAETSGERPTAVESASKKRETAEPKEGKSAALNDSIECNLNNMFDDVNESIAEEPTQMLTQHLERVLESTQVERPVEADEDAKSDSTEAPQPEEESAAVFQIPEIMSTQEIFADLPFVNIRSTPRKDVPSVATETRVEAAVSTSKKPNKRESDTMEAAADVAEQQNRNKKSPKKPRRTKGAERLDLVVPEAPQRSKKKTVIKAAKEKPAEMDMDVEEMVAVVNVPARGADRRKLRGSEGSSERSANRSRGRTVNDREKLPLKKRGFPIPRREESPAEMEPQISPTVAESPKGAKRPRRKKSETPAKSGETPTRLSAVVDPEEVVAAAKIATPRAKATRGARLRAPSSMVRVNYEKSESPTPLASVPVRKGNTRSRGSQQETAVVGDPGALGEKSEPEKPAASRRGRKKALEKSTVASDEESAVAPTPAKRSRRSKAASPALAVADPSARPETPVSSTRGRGKRKVAVQKPQDSSAAESTDPKSARSNEDEVPIQKRKTRGAANNATESPRPSSGETFFDIGTQPSLESQEIQAILSGAETGASRTPRFGFRSSLSVEKRVDSDDKPAVKPRPAAKKQGIKVAANQTTIGEFLKPKVEPDPGVQESPRRRGRLSIRGRKVASLRAAAQPAEKENGIEEVGGQKPGKKSVASSDDESVKLSPLRRGRSSTVDLSPLVTPLAKTKHKILFTGLNDPQLTSVVSNLGGTVTEKPSECTALVTDKVRRTYKFLCAMATAVPIVSVDWLRESDKRGRFLETRDFLLEDPVEEAKFNFNLSRSLELAKDDRLLEGYTVVLTPNTAPPPSGEMKGLIQACGGKALVRAPTSWPDKSLVISRQEDVKNAKKFLAKAPGSVPLVSVEFILTGILRHELNFEEHALAI